jgi:hypothetical protein
MGFIAGPAADMSWLTEHLVGENPTAGHLLDGAGTCELMHRTSLAGRPRTTFVVEQLSPGRELRAPGQATEWPSSTRPNR